jgi:arylsulfatase
VPFEFTGKLNRVTVDLGESSVTPEAMREFQEKAAKRD